jgi:sialidase-1
MALTAFGTSQMLSRFVGARLFAACLILVLSAVPAWAAEPLSESRIDLFRGGDGHYELYRIPGIVVTAKGTVIVYCEARKNAASDWGDIDILMRRSVDGGQTFAEPVRIADVPGPKSKNPVAAAKNLGKAGEVTYNNPVMIAEPDGRLHLLFCLEYFRCFLSHSDDDGVTWSPAEEITKAFEAFRPEYDWKVLATGPGHGVAMQSGRLVVPVWLSTGTGGHAHRPSSVSVIVSDDHGQNWMRGPIIVATTDQTPNPSETVAAELSDGSLLLSVRNESARHRRLLSRSSNGFDNWSAPTFHPQLFEPICMAGLLSVAHDNRRVLIHVGPDSSDAAPPLKPINEVVTGGGKSLPRRNLSLQVSRDDAGSWSERVALEPGRSGYCDLAWHPSGAVLCLFESGFKDAAGKDRGGQLTLLRLPLPRVLDATMPR